MTATEEPPRIAYEDPVTLFGQLVCPGGGSTVSGQTVTAYQRIAKMVGFKSVATATTVEHGFYSITVPKVTGDSFFYVEALGARSGVKHVRVAPTVTLEGPPPGQLRTGFRNRVEFKGKVSPADEGARLALQREFSSGSEEWRVIQSGIVGPGGNYSIKHEFLLPGDANVRIVVLAHNFYAAGISETLSYVVSQNQNPNLTINPSADPVAYGQQLKITGKLASGSGQVTLFSHARGNPRFTEVTKTSTNGSGEYTFTIASATANAAYKVTSGSISSAVLWEGVPYTLTAGVNMTTVQAGQPVTFSGTVTPSRKGHVVYLEHQNASTHGFHVVNVGTVGELKEGEYSIPIRPWASGKQVYRVRIPGDPENQGASSPTFAIEVTPANPLALNPGKEGKLPSEGQL